MPKLILTDGRGVAKMNLKSSFGIDPWQDETPGVWVPDKAANVLARENRLVPSMFAGLVARAQAMADLPFSIYDKDDKQIDDSAEYHNKIGFLPNPSQFLWMVECSLCTFGRAYFFKGVGTQSKKLKLLKYWMPETVTPKIDKSDGLISFRRSVDNQDYKPEQLLYFWLPDPSVEIGEPVAYPYASAMTAAEAAGAITGWVRDYMKRGAIKAMLLAVDGMPPEGEIERIENWFNRFMAGVRGLYWRVFNASNVKPTIVGDGLEALKGITVNSDLRYEIHTALGTRHLLEDENFATANARERQFYNVTVMPDARFIQQTLNDQILTALGWRLEFEPERLNAFEVLKAERAASLANLYDVLIQSVTADIALELAMDFLGYDMSEEQKTLWKKGIAAKDKLKATVTADQPAGSQVNANEVVKPEPQLGERPTSGGSGEKSRKALEELGRWEARSRKKGSLSTWHAIDLPDEIYKAVKSGEMSFDEARAQLRGFNSVFDPEAIALLEAIKTAVEALPVKDDAS